MRKSIFVASLAMACFVGSAEAKPLNFGGAQSLPGPSYMTQAAQAPGGSTGFKGDKCLVVSGPNTGKNGTMTTSGKCVGVWGEQKCKRNGRDNGKCKNLSTSIGGATPSFRDRFISRGGYGRLETGRVSNSPPAMPAPSAPGTKSDRSVNPRVKSRFSHLSLGS